MKNEEEIKKEIREVIDILNHTIYHEMPEYAYGWRVKLQTLEWVLGINEYKVIDNKNEVYNNEKRL